jgi:hypothetical protein
VAKVTQRKALEPAYRRTVYRAFAPGGPIDLRIGYRCRALDRLLAASGCTHWAFLTAWNPRSRPLPVWRNATRSRHLAQALHALGCRFLPGLGIPQEPGWQPEVSLLVLGMPAARALRIARGFGQNAVVAGRRGRQTQLLWCRE